MMDNATTSNTAHGLDMSSTAGNKVMGLMGDFAHESMADSVTSPSDASCETCTTAGTSNETRTNESDANKTTNTAKAPTLL
jgi:hypothetical protein